MMDAAILSHFRETAPRLAYCTDDPRDGQYRRPRSEALKYRHIQPNTNGLIRWLCFDIDHNDAAYLWQEVNACPPSLVMVNPANGHAHYAYALNAPVPKTEISRIKPLRYLSAIQEGMRKQLDADLGYSGGLIKTPNHPDWYTLPFGGSYDLDEMAEYCTLPSHEEMKRITANTDYAGLGRNCTLFEQVRTQAYKDVRKYFQIGYQPFYTHCLILTETLNRFPLPLPQSETRSIARSVSRWIWQRFSEAGFKAIQSRRGSRKGATKRAELMPKVFEMAERGFTQQVIADSLGVTQRTVSNWLKTK